MKILEEIMSDHDKVREMFLHIEKKEEEGQKTFRTLVIEILAHHEAEEQILFEQLTDDKESQELRLKLIAEHDSLRRAMQVVLDTDPEDDNWKARLMVCKDVFLHHSAEEEKELFEKLDRKVTSEQTIKLYYNFISVGQKSMDEAENLVNKGMILRPEDHLPKSAGRARQNENKESAGIKPGSSRKQSNPASFYQIYDTICFLGRRVMPRQEALPLENAGASYNWNP